MRASYDSIDNKQKMCEKVNKDITFIQFFHTTRLHSTELFKIFFSLLTLQLLFCKKLVGREKIFQIECLSSYCYCGTTGNLYQEKVRDTTTVKFFVKKEFYGQEVGCPQSSFLNIAIINR